MCNELINLICIPYAGGYSTCYSMWKKYLNKKINMITLEHSGRGARMKEPLYDNFQEAVEDIYRRLAPMTGQASYVMYGHSMGSILVFEVIQKLIENGNQLPYHIILSGSSPIQCNQYRKIISNLPKDEFRQELIKYNGIPKEVFENESIMDIFIPVLRADFAILENYSYFGGSYKIPCSLSVLYGLEDQSAVELNRWCELTEKQCELYAFRGGHFFIHDLAVAKQINKIVLKQYSSCTGRSEYE